MACWPDGLIFGVIVSEYREGGLRLAQVGFVKPDDPIREGDARPDRRLDQSLQIEGDVVILVPQVFGGGVIAAPAPE